MRYNGSCEKREVLIKWCSPGEFALSRHVLREREACGYMENFSLGKTGSMPCCPAVVAKWPQGHLADLMPWHQVDATASTCVHPWGCCWLTQHLVHGRGTSTMAVGMARRTTAWAGALLARLRSGLQRTAKTTPQREISASLHRPPAEWTSLNSPTCTPCYFTSNCETFCFYGFDFCHLNIPFFNNIDFSDMPFPPLHWSYCSWTFPFHFTLFAALSRVLFILVLLWFSFIFLSFP